MNSPSIYFTKLIKAYSHYISIDVFVLLFIRWLKVGIIVMGMGHRSFLIFANKII